MGGGGVIGERPVGASAWCSGQDVLNSLDGLFHQNPGNPQYQAAKTASLAFFQTAATTGEWEDLWTAYNKAYAAANMTPCSGWLTYLGALGTLTPTPGSNGGNVVTTVLTPKTSAILTFGSVPAWMAVGLNVSAGGITGGQTVSDFDATTVTLTANVNATVKSGDTIAFSLPSGLGQTNIQLIAQARYDGLSNNVKMKTNKHDPHNHASSGHKVKVTHETDHSITIDSPYMPPGAARRNRNR